MADLGLDGAAAVEVCDEFWCQAAPRAADQDAGRLNAVAAISGVDDGPIGALVGQNGHPALVNSATTLQAEEPCWR